jgi:3'(2'), 5'-bisphosphate nucleotidase
MIIDANFLDNLSNDLKRIVSDASQAIMDVYKKNTFDTEIKSDGSPVTEADENANKIIIQSLNIISPDISIVSEETYEKSDEIPNEPYWLVDPLDGTKEFINKSEDFTINIALINNHKSVFGAIYKPLTDELFIGGKNLPAFRKQNNIKEKLQTESRTENCIICQSKSHITKREKSFIEELKNKFNSYKVINAGSSIKICYIAQGKCHIYPRFGDTYQWDIAAGHAILKASGGDILDLNLKEIIYLSSHKKKVNGFFALSDIPFWVPKIQ